MVSVREDYKDENMKSTLGALALTAMLILPTSASFAAPEPDSGAAEELDPSEIICKAERKLGSNMIKKRCATRAQWDRAREDSQDWARKNLNRGCTGCTGGSSSCV